MNFFARQKQTYRQREPTCCQGGGNGGGWIESLGLADANFYIQNG